MQISEQVFITGVGCTQAIASTWLGPFNAAMVRFGIDTPNAIAAFLANVGVESLSLTTLSENMNYSAQRLAEVWPNRYSVTTTEPYTYTPNALANSIAGNPEKIANNVYASRLGNGDEASGDGWKYRGAGPIQITGRTTITRCGVAIGLDLINHPEQLQQPQGGSLSAAWFFNDAGCIAPANNGNIASVIAKVNGHAPSAANGGPLRTSRYHAALYAIQSGQ